jgi:hypothetical protein
VLPSQALGLSMALHELATNAAKYGALSRPEGRVDPRWDVQQDELKLSWRESGGPLVVPPTRRGFGSRLIENALSAELDGQIHLEFLPGGVHCSITAALNPTLNADPAPSGIDQANNRQIASATQLVGDASKIPGDDIPVAVGFVILVLQRAIFGRPWDEGRLQSILLCRA